VSRIARIAIAVVIAISGLLLYGDPGSPFVIVWVPVFALVVLVAILALDAAVRAFRAGLDITRDRRRI
jgi:hypothetical protein